MHIFVNPPLYIIPRGVVVDGKFILKKNVASLLNYINDQSYAYFVSPHLGYSKISYILLIPPSLGAK